MIQMTWGGSYLALLLVCEMAFLHVSAQASVSLCVKERAAVLTSLKEHFVISGLEALCCFSVLNLVSILALVEKQHRVNPGLSLNPRSSFSKACSAILAKKVSFHPSTFFWAFVSIFPGTFTLQRPQWHWYIDL